MAMYIPFQMDLRESARVLRKNQTKAEQVLWRVLRKRSCLGYLFLRQKPLLSFIADFYCSELRLIIEVDGKYHEKQHESDEQRTIELQMHGLKVIRYTNEQVLYHLPEVLENLKSHIHKMTNT